jgi:hypothetical protein
MDFAFGEATPRRQKLSLDSPKSVETSEVSECPIKDGFNPIGGKRLLKFVVDLARKESDFQ